MSLPYGITASDIVAYNIILLLKSNSGRLLSIFLKVMIVGEALAKLTFVVKAEISEDGRSLAFVQPTYSPFAVQAFAVAKGVNICGTNLSLAQADKLGSTDW